MASLGAPATDEVRPTIRRGGWCTGSHDQHAPTIWPLPSAGRCDNVVRYLPGPPMHASVRELVPTENRLASASPT